MIEGSQTRLEIDASLAVLAIDRPNALNALNLALLGELGSRLDAIESREDVGVVILTGTGSRAFVAGADIREMSGFGPGEAAAYSSAGQDLFDRIEGFSIPVIAAVNGFCLGGGCELAMACHLRVAARSARFGQPEVKLGLVPGFGGTRRLPALVGRPQALEALLTGEMFPAETALQWGLVNQVVDDDRLLEVCRGLADKILGNAPGAVRECLRLVNLDREAGHREALKRENTAFAARFKSWEVKEGTGAFLEKRTPVFRGR